MNTKAEKKMFFSTNEIAKILGVSHMAIYKKIKNGQIKAEKIGRNYVILANNIQEILGGVLGKKQKTEIETVVKRVVKEYGETLRLLGKE